VDTDLRARAREAHRLADAVLAPLAAHDARAARLLALVREIDAGLHARAGGDAEADAGTAAADDETGEEIVELFVTGNPSPLRVTAAVADAVWNTMFVKEPTLFVDVALAGGGVARVRASAVTGFRFHPGAPLPERAPKRRA
jgi:hypothetical protein